MRLRRQAIASLILALVLLAGCGPAMPTATAVLPTNPPGTPTSTPVPAPTSAPPTPTPLPPTATPAPTRTVPPALPPLTGSGGGVIVFSSRRGEGDYEVYVMNADGSDKRQVTKDVDESENPAWSPDGTQIAFSAAVGYHRDLYVVNVDGTGLRQLTDTPDVDEHDPAWSPDGTQIVFQSNPEAQWDIYVINADGTNRRRLTTDVANDTSPEWALISSRGTHILAEESGHFIQHDQPDLVIEAIRQVVSESSK